MTMLLSGSSVQGEEARASGWPIGSWPPGEQRKAAHEWAAELAAAAPLAVQSNRRAFCGHLPKRVRAALERELAARLERRPPTFTGQ